MKLIRKTIFTGFAPNIMLENVWTVLVFLLLPWQWSRIRKGQYSLRAENLLNKYFSIRNSFVFDSGRSALFYALRSLDVGKGDKVFVQAYTCVVVINAIKQVGAKPIYIDINDDFNMNPSLLNKKAKFVKAKALIIQHTFGSPAKLDELLVIAKKYNLKTIEDCAHSLGVSYEGVLTGTMSDVGMFSFGSDKIISCVRGGALITANLEIANKIKTFQKHLAIPSLKYTLQHLMSIPIFAISKPFYGILVGKAFLALSQRMGIINKIVYKEEKEGCVMKEYPVQLANSLAKILCQQLQQVDKLNKHRKYVASMYFKGLNNLRFVLPVQDGSSVYLRYTLLVDNPKKLHDYMKRQGVILGSWYNNVVAPKDILMSETDYINNSCPQAEFLAHRSINLPTNQNIKKNQAEYIINLLKRYEDQNN